MPAINLDRLVQVYGPFSRSLRVFRGLAGAGVLVLVLGPLIVLGVLPILPGLQEALILIGITSVMMFFGLMAIDVYESLAACSRSAIRSTMTFMGALALAKLALSFHAIFDGGGRWQVALPVVLGTGLNLAVSWLIVRGLWPLASGQRAFERELFSSRTRERAGFLRPFHALVGDVCRMAGLVIPRGQHRVDRTVVAAALGAFALEGSVYYSYLQAGWNVSKNAHKLAALDAPGIILAVAFTIVGPAITLAIGRLFFALSRRLRSLALRRSLKTATELRRDDLRPPILFLRSFRDDQVSLSEAPLPFALRFFDPGVEAQTLEALVIRSMAPIGPVIAIGNPADTLPPLGAARSYLENEDWQGVIRFLIAEARIVVISLDDTPGVQWELREIAAQDALRKTLAILPPRFTDRQHQYLRILADALASARTPIGIASVHTIGFLFADSGRVVSIDAGRSSELEYDLALRLVEPWIRGRLSDSMVQDAHLG
ncbi:MAG: hypothetical protein EOP82_30565 [Variovorax sp.]|nr:MAG: hypothetical protein EOP82_30565 [Variovorax sp.]